LDHFSAPAQRSHAGLAWPTATLAHRVSTAGLGAFVLAHLWVYVRTLNGPISFARVASHLPVGGGAIAIALVLLILIAVHALSGFTLAARMPRQPLGSVKRATGYATLAIVLLHAAASEAPLALGRIDGESIYAALVKAASATRFGLPLTSLAWLLGLAVFTVHVALGTYLLFASRGVLRGHAVAAASAVLGTAVFLCAADVVIHLSTGEGVFIPALLLGHPSAATQCELAEPPPPTRAAPQP
jgi:hypothetical protein